MFLLALWLAVPLGLGALAFILRSEASAGSRVAVVAAMAAVEIGFLAAEPRAPAPMVGAPKVAGAAGYVGSGACASCHPGEYDSWSKTFHRTMTQLASRGTVLAPLATPIEAEGHTWTLAADADGAIWEQNDRGEKQRVLLTTGSHHMQGYWVAGGDGALRMLPFVFARDEKKAIPRREAFVEPPLFLQPDVRWNSNCIACHATAGEPRANADTGGYDTRVAELGIACEACHGAGGAHIAHHHDPFERLSQRMKQDGDPTIVNPARLSAERAAAICGQCHAYAYPRDEEAFWRSGYVQTFRPGQALDASRILLTPAVLTSPRGPRLDIETTDVFWPDGTVRVAGREHNALVLSACFRRGSGARQLTCTTCHSMHASDPDDMLRRDEPAQAICLSCHSMSARHSRHAPGSPGDACVACHMPKTSYALRTAIRSHRVASPDASRASGAPNACNLCHLDRSLAWTVRTLREWKGEADTSGDRPEPPASAKGLLTKDAAERVLWADAMGDADALAASGSDWEAPLLGYAAEHDPYAVVRYVAARSERKVRAARQTRSRNDVRIGEMEIQALTRERYDRDIAVAE